MNRPNQWEEKYDLNGSLMVNEYLNDLEQYCDELEVLLSGCKGCVDALKAGNELLNKNLEHFEKAFNMAISNWVKHALIEPPYATANDDAIITYQELKVLGEVQDE